MVFPHRKTDVWSTPISIYNEFRRRQLHVDICTVFDENDQYTDKYLDPFMEKDYDVVFNMDYGQFPIEKLRREYWKNKDTCFVVELGDDPQQFQANLRKIEVQSCDIGLSPDYRTCQTYKQIFKDINFYWWKHFADSQVFKPLNNITPEYLITTSCYGHRPYIDYLEEVYKNFFSLKNNLGPEEHNYHLNNGKFIFQQSRHGEITRRVFEGTLTGRPVVTDRLSLDTRFHKIFIDNQNIILYGSSVELFDKLSYYISHYEEAAAIGVRGCNTTHMYHTEIIRVRELLQMIRKFNDKRKT